MANYRLTPDDSYIDSTTAAGYFYYGTAGADSLTVDAGTLIYALGEDADAGIALVLDNRAPWTLTMNGSLYSNGYGVLLDPYMTGTKASTITVGAEGSVYGKFAGINIGDFSDTPLAGAPVVIKIDGEVGASFDDTIQGVAIQLTTTGAHTVTNTGKVYGYWGIISDGTAADTITNSGEMDWVAAGAGTNKLVNTYLLRGYFGGWGNDSFENNGANAYVGADVQLGDGTNTLKNSGTINDYDIGQWGVLGGEDTDTVTNSGTINGGVNLGNGTNSFTSSDGTIGVTDGASYTGYDGSDTVTNNAPSHLEGGVHVGNGTNKLTNTGSIGADADGYSYAAGYSGQPNAGYQNDVVANTGANAILEGGVKLGDGSNSLTNSGTIGAAAGVSVEGGLQNDSITNSGILLGGVKLGDGTNSLTNSKQILGDVSAGTGVDTFTNTSSGVAGLVNLGSGNNKVSNSGLIASLVLGSGADNVTNEASGRITSLTLGGASLANTVDTLTNRGMIGADGSTSILGDAAGDTITNSGTILGLVSLGNGINKLTNTGAIGENQHTAILGGTGTDSVTSSKAILGGIDLADGTNSLTNSGAVGEDVHHLSYSGGAGTDTVTNSGTLIGDVWLGGGSDVFTDYAGKVQGKVFGIIDLGTGDDKFFGGNNAETVIDNDGADTYTLGGGDDQFLAVNHTNNGIDTIDGGAGLDVYVAADSTSGVIINLSTAAQIDNFHVGPVVNLAASTAVGDEIGTDIVKAIENAAGGSGNDIIVGTDGTTAANYLLGNDGNDDLAGLGGADTLIGGDGNDGLMGGVGKDVLTGGGGDTFDEMTDYFVYTSLSDSGVTASTRDTITDFELGIDVIDLHLIDANTTSGHTGDDAFTFIGTNAFFSHTAGELRAYWTVSGQIVEGDVNGDGRADFSIQLNNLAPGDVFQSTDFAL